MVKVSITLSKEAEELERLSKEVGTKKVSL